MNSRCRHSGRIGPVRPWPVLALLALLTAACASAPLVERYYRLDAGAPPVAPVAAGYEGDVTLLLLSIPERIDRPQLTLLDGAAHVIVQDDARWAEPVRGAVARVLSERLARDLPQAWIAQTLPSHPRHACSVSVELDALDVLRGGEARLDARWTLRGADGTVRRSGALHRSVRPAGSDTAAVVAAWDAELGVLADDIARGVAETMGGSAVEP